MTSITVHSAQERVVARPYRDDDDFWRVRDLLVETYPITLPDFNWDVRRWDGSRFYSRSPSGGRTGMAVCACGRRRIVGWWARCTPMARAWLSCRSTPTTGTLKKR